MAKGSKNFDDSVSRCTPLAGVVFSSYSTWLLVAQHYSMEFGSEEIPQSPQVMGFRYYNSVGTNWKQVSRVAECWKGQSSVLAPTLSASYRGFQVACLSGNLRMCGIFQVTESVCMHVYMVDALVWSETF